MYGSLHQVLIISRVVYKECVINSICATIHKLMADYCYDILLIIATIRFDHMTQNPVDNMAENPFTM